MKLTRFMNSLCLFFSFVCLVLSPLSNAYSFSACHQNKLNELYQEMRLEELQSFDFVRTWNRLSGREGKAELATIYSSIEKTISRKISFQEKRIIKKFVKANKVSESADSASSLVLYDKLKGLSPAEQRSYFELFSKGGFTEGELQLIEEKIFAMAKSKARFTEEINENTLGRLRVILSDIAESSELHPINARPLSFEDYDSLMKLKASELFYVKDVKGNIYYLEGGEHYLGDPSKVLAILVQTDEFKHVTIVQEFGSIKFQNKKFLFTKHLEKKMNSKMLSRAEKMVDEINDLHVKKLTAPPRNAVTMDKYKKCLEGVETGLVGGGFVKDKLIASTALQFAIMTIVETFLVKDPSQCTENDKQGCGESIFNSKHRAEQKLTDTGLSLMTTTLSTLISLLVLKRVEALKPGIGQSMASVGAGRVVGAYGAVFLSKLATRFGIVNIDALMRKEVLTGVFKHDSDETKKMVENVLFYNRGWALYSVSHATVFDSLLLRKIPISLFKACLRAPNSFASHLASLKTVRFTEMVGMTALYFGGRQIIVGE
jgi:hypothetical protein